MKNSEQIYFLRQLVAEKQRHVGEVLNISESAFTNKKLLESAKSHQRMCSEALRFLKKIEEKKVV